MGLIAKLKSCKDTFFQPHASNYEDNLTYIEFLNGVLQKINETVDQVNTNTTWIAEFSEKYADFEERIKALEESVKTELPALIKTTADALRVELEAYLNQVKRQLREEFNVEIDRLDTRIDNVAIGKINVIDPSTGQTTPLQIVINNLFDQTREGAITCQEFDDLGKTCQEFEAFNMTAYQFDTSAKTIMGA